MKKVFVHVGMQKTGTTFLQQRCFPHLTGLHYVHHENYSPPPEAGITAWFFRMAGTDSLFYDRELEQRRLDSLLAAVPEDSVLISLERLFGNMHYNFNGNSEITQNLGSFFPDASIILVIRRQDDLLESLYRQSLRRHHSRTVDGFLNYADGHLRGNDRFPLNIPTMNARQVDLHRYVRNYATVFGRDNLLVLPYERLRTDQRGFLGALYDFMGVEPFYPADDGRVHQSYSPLSCRIALPLNRFVRSDTREHRAWQVIPHHPFAGYLDRSDATGPVHRLLAQIDRRLSLNYVLETVVDRLPHSGGNLISDRRRDQIMELHRESNRALDAEFTLDLARYGYY